MVNNKINKRIMVTSILLIMLFVAMSTSNTYASSHQVSVTIPNFQVKVNENWVDSHYEKYPLVVYKGITYFPLTWHWCSELGLNYSYTQKDGLYIISDHMVIGEEDKPSSQGGHFISNHDYSAEIASYPVHINGKLIDNKSEEYPLLNFNGITYVPLTWQYVKNEFAWDMLWENGKGLEISSNVSLQPYEIGVPVTSGYFLKPETYENYAIIQRNADIVTTSLNEGDTQYNIEHAMPTYYKLNYSENRLKKIDAPNDLDSSYQSGAVLPSDVSDEFKAEDNQLYYQSQMILNLEDQKLEGKTIQYFAVNQYSCNGLKVYSITVYFENKGKIVPPPYTPQSSYVFIDTGDGNLNKVETWTEGRVLSNVFPKGDEAVYLCSDYRYFGSARMSNGQGMVLLIHADMTTQCLNDQWDDWNSVKGLGLDEKGNLYIENIWYPEFDIPSENKGRVSPINDGFFKLSTQGSLTKIYPYIQTDEIAVSPLGDLYAVAGWRDAIIHLQTGSVLTLD